MEKFDKSFLRKVNYITNDLKTKCALEKFETEEGGEVEVISGSDFNRYNCKPAFKVLKHKYWCCPFCSHGETIQLKIVSEYRGRVLGTYKRAYLECHETCMSYGIFEASFLNGYTEEEKNSEILKKSISIFKKLASSTKEINRFLMVEN